MGLPVEYWLLLPLAHICAEGEKRELCLCGCCLSVCVCFFSRRLSPESRTHSTRVYSSRHLSLSLLTCIVYMYIYCIFIFMSKKLLRLTNQLAFCYRWIKGWTTPRYTHNSFSVIVMFFKLFIVTCREYFSELILNIIEDESSEIYRWQELEQVTEFVSC